MKSEIQLKSMTIPELKVYAKDIGAEIKGNPSEDTIISRIMDKQSEPNFIDPNPEPEVELEGANLFEEPILTHESGRQYTANEVVEATVRDLGIPPEEWNDLPDTEKEEELQEFVEATNFIPSEYEPDPVKTNKADKDRLQKIADEFPSVSFEVQDNYYTVRYLGMIYSGNLGLADQVFRRQLQVMTQY